MSFWKEYPNRKDWRKPYRHQPDFLWDTLIAEYKYKKKYGDNNEDIDDIDTYTPPKYTPSKGKRNKYNY